LPRTRLRQRTSHNKNAIIATAEFVVEEEAVEEVEEVVEVPEQS
jgi:hypothetical protein